MRSPPLPLVILLAVTILANIVSHVGSIPANGPGPLRILFLALLAAQCGLLASWFSLGASNFWLRVATLVAAVALGSGLLDHEHNLERFRNVAMVQLFLVIVLTGMLRLFGFQWARNRAGNDADKLQARQFALRELLGWTT